MHNGCRTIVMVSRDEEAKAQPFQMRRQNVLIIATTSAGNETGGGGSIPGLLLSFAEHTG